MAVSATKTFLILMSVKCINMLVVIGLIVRGSFIIGFYPSIILATTMVWAVSKAFIDPIIAIHMMCTHYYSIEEDPEPAIDLVEKFTQLLGNFKTIVAKSNDPIHRRYQGMNTII